jgi:hypothetical protein
MKSNGGWRGSSEKRILTSRHDDELVKIEKLVEKVELTVVEGVGWGRRRS